MDTRPHAETSRVRIHVEYSVIHQLVMPHTQMFGDLCALLLHKECASYVRASEIASWWSVDTARDIIGKALRCAQPTSVDAASSAKVYDRSAPSNFTLDLQLLNRVLRSCEIKYTNDVFPPVYQTLLSCLALKMLQDRLSNVKTGSETEELLSAVDEALRNLDTAQLPSYMWLAFVGIAVKSACRFFEHQQSIPPALLMKISAVLEVVSRIHDSTDNALLSSPAFVELNDGIANVKHYLKRFAQHIESETLPVATMRLLNENVVWGHLLRCVVEALYFWHQFTKFSCRTLTAWRITCDRLKPTAVANIDSLISELDEFRIVMSFLCERSLGNRSLQLELARNDAKPGDSAATVASMRSSLAHVRTDLTGNISHKAQIALRVFVPSQNGRLFVSRFDDMLRSTDGDVDADDNNCLRRADRVTLLVASDLERLVSAGDVRISSFISVLDLLSSTVHALSAQRAKDEMALVGFVFCYYHYSDSLTISYACAGAHLHRGLLARV